jgi:hypothetical protein
MSDPRSTARRFLGAESVAPLDLLGLSASDFAQAAREPDALRRLLEARLAARIEVVNLHPQALTPEADDLRLALHAAAAQLEDPALRDWALAGGAQQNVEMSAPKLEPETREGEPVEIWTPAPRETRGPSVVLPAPVEIVRDGLTPVVIERDPTGRHAIIMLLVGLVVFGAVLGALAMLLRKPAPALPAAPPVAAGGVQSGIGTPTTPDALGNVTPPAESASPEGEASAPGATQTPALGAIPPLAPHESNESVLAELEQLIVGSAISPDDAVVKASAMVRPGGSLARSWAFWRADERVAAQTRFIDVVFRLARAGNGGATLIDAMAESLDPASLSADPMRVLAAGWAAGMINRLTREGDPGGGVGLRVRSATARPWAEQLARADGSFGAGASAAMVWVRTTLSVGLRDEASSAPAAQAWEAWRACALAATDGDPDGQARLVLGAIENLASAGPSAAKSPRTAAVVRNLAGSLNWSASGESSRWLLRSLAGETIPAPVLWAVTTAIVDGKLLTGTTGAMVLPAMGGTEQRARVREAFATIWGEVKADDRTAAQDAWSEAARAAISNSPDGTAARLPGAALVRAAMIARLADAAHLIDAGRLSEAKALLDKPPKAPEVPDEPPADGTPMFDTPAGDEAWSRAYFAAGQNPAERLAKLKEFSSDRIGPLEASILAGEAFRGSPVQVRDAARLYVEANFGKPTMVHAVLSIAHEIPPTVENNRVLAKLIGVTLPGPTSPSWRLILRRELVTRMLETLASGSEAAATQWASAGLSASYQRRARPAEEPDGAVEADLAARALRERLSESVRRTVALAGFAPTAGEVFRRHAGRLTLAAGPAQRFAAEQVTSVELSAILTASARPEKQDDVRAVLAELAEKRRSARHIAEQMEAGERAAVRLWLIRWDRSPAP